MDRKSAAAGEREDLAPKEESPVTEAFRIIIEEDPEKAKQIIDDHRKLHTQIDNDEIQTMRNNQSLMKEIRDYLICGDDMPDTVCYGQAELTLLMLEIIDEFELSDAVAKESLRLTEQFSKKKETGKVLHDAKKNLKIFRSTCAAGQSFGDMEG